MSEEQQEQIQVESEALIEEGKNLSEDMHKLYDQWGCGGRSSFGTELEYQGHIIDTVVDDLRIVKRFTLDSDAQNSLHPSQIPKYLENYDADCQAKYCDTYGGLYRRWEEFYDKFNKFRKENPVDWPEVEENTETETVLLTGHTARSLEIDKNIQETLELLEKNENRSAERKMTEQKENTNQGTALAIVILFLIAALVGWVLDSFDL